MRSFFVASLLVLILAAAPARAQGGAPFPSPITTSESYATSPSSNLLPRSIFDPSRLTISNSMVFGYSTGGYGSSGGSAGLFTSSLGYRVSNRAALRVDLGAHMNPAFGGNGTDKGFYLQGAAFDWRPTRSSLVRVEYRDMRSPLQQGYGYGSGGYGLGYNPGYAGWGTPYGANLGEDPRSGDGLPGDPLRN